MPRSTLPFLGALLTLFGSAPLMAECPPVFERTWGTTGAGPGQFKGPYGITLDQASNVYVADLLNSRIQKFNANGAFLFQWGSPGSGHGQFNSPTSVSVDPRGFIYVMDSGNDRVQKFTSAAGFVMAWGTSGSGPGQFLIPRGVAADGLGHVYVADTNNRRIQKFTDAGVLMAVWPVGASPFDISTGTSGDLFVVFHDEAIVRQYNSGGQLLFQWGLFGAFCGEMNQPFGLCVDHDGNVHVADAVNNRIQKFTANGEVLALQGAAWGGNPGMFKYPRDVAVNAQGDIYVADTFNDRIQKFNTAGGTCVPCTPPAPPPSSAPRIMIHVMGTTSKNICAAGELTDCRIGVTTADLSTPSGPFYFAYLLAVRSQAMEDIAGLQCGIAYESWRPTDTANGSGVDIFGWTLCATLQFPSPPGPAWPAPGSGNLITWAPETRCQTGNTAVAGYFYLAAYSPDQLRATVRPVDQAAKLATCEGVEFRVERLALGYAAFSREAAGLGCNPCLAPCEGPIPVQPATWSSIKALFHR